MHLVVSDRAKEVCALDSRVVTAKTFFFTFYFFSAYFSPLLQKSELVCKKYSLS